MYLVDVISRRVLGSPELLGVRPIEHEYEFIWSFNAQECLLLDTMTLLDMRQELMKANVVFEEIEEA
jgi:hypothetical protein